MKTDKIFQLPFDRPSGRRTGIALSLAYEIIKAHGGELKIETTEGESAAFSIQIPIS